MGFLEEVSALQFGQLAGLVLPVLGVGQGALAPADDGQPSCTSSAFSATMCNWSLGRSSSAKMALTGHSGMQTAQSMHSSGSMARKLGPS
jgi:hypothetical protein